MSWSQQKITGSVREEASQFGNSTGVWGTTAIVGNYKNTTNATDDDSLTLCGAAYVFTKNGSTWSQQQKLVGSGTNGRLETDQFGYSVGIYQDTAVVGANYHDYNGAGGESKSNAGAAYVYLRSGGVWTQQQILCGSGTNGRIASDLFGSSVAIYEDTIVVGAYGHDYSDVGNVSLSTAGAAYVYLRSGGVWTQQQKLCGSGTNGRIAADQFGYSVAISGDTIVVGAYLQDFDGNGQSLKSAAGAAYVYLRSGGVWTQQQKLVGSGTNGRIASDYFGHAVAISSDTIVVGAYSQDFDGNGQSSKSAAGAAYVYLRSGGVWTQQQKLCGSGTNGRIAGDFLGERGSIGIYGDVITAGVRNQAYDANGSNSLIAAGASYVYLRSGGVWTQTDKLVATGTNGRIASDFFGASACVGDI